MRALIAVVFAAAAAAQSAASSACSSMLQGYGPTPTPNTDEVFKSFQPFADAARNAVTPSLYQLTFQNLNASQSAQSTNVYMGYYELKSYDPASCTAICDQTSGCVGTNLYFERNPSLLPAARCPDPPAITLIKCALWGSPVTPAEATNDGQYQQEFHVVIAGSNGYQKLPAQACSAISSAWEGSQFSWPTGQVNWKSWTAAYGSQYQAESTMPPSRIMGAGGAGGW